MNQALARSLVPVLSRNPVKTTDLSDRAVRAVRIGICLYLAPVLLLVLLIGGVAILLNSLVAGLTQVADRLMAR